MSFDSVEDSVYVEACENSLQPVDEPNATEGSEANLCSVASSTRYEQNMVLDATEPVETNSTDMVSIDNDEDWEYDSQITGDESSDHGEQDVTVSVSDDKKIGCQHYLRKCLIISPCCGKKYWCRHCHNEDNQVPKVSPKEAHEIDRKKIVEIECAICSTRQIPSNECVNCRTIFSDYFCGICNFWDDKAIKKKAYHCEECGICRVGGRENFFHCKKCGSCYGLSLKGSHICIENALKADCPICLEDMFSSTRRVTILDCGHTIHEDCVVKLQMTPSTRLQQFRCPTCSKSIASYESVWKSLDLEIEQTPIPELLKRDAWILCNDCGNQTLTTWHFIGLKCRSCSSYNTREIVVNTP